MRRGRRRKQAEETATILYNNGSERRAKMIILEDRDPRFQQEGVTIQFRRYKANLDSIDYSIDITDKIRRDEASDDSPRGTSDESQVLQVEDIKYLWGVQQLQLRDTRQIR